jgi:H2-forming N5,N10-methylenetetrahydromethanopterin dehydrogenase-like enzyme
MNLKFLFGTLTVIVFATAPLCRAASDDTVLLNTLGYTTGQSVLLTHMAVGTLADAYVGKAYKSEQATTFITTYLNVTNGMKNQLKKLVDEDTLSKSDSQFVQNTIDVLDLVLREANDLKDYIRSSKQADAQTYDGSRKKALKEIKTLLGMKD